jgi:hypothetical protein
MRRWAYRFLFLMLALLVVGCIAIWVLEFYPRRVAHPVVTRAQGILAIEHARIYTSPADPPH